MTITWASGVDGEPDGTGYNVIVLPSLMSPACAQYQVTPPLTRVFDGDDAANPTATVQLEFPDQATAQSVLAGLWAENDG